MFIWLFILYFDKNPLNGRTNKTNQCPHTTSIKTTLITNNL